MNIKKEIKRIRILEYAFSQFTTLGISSVTMDDIAAGLQMGKGTLYRYFPSKEELISETIDHTSNQVREKMQLIMKNQELNGIQKLSQVFSMVGSVLTKINPAIFIQMEKSMPQVFEKINQIRQKVILENIMILLNEGKEKGDFRSDMDSYFVAQIIIGAANHLMSAEVLINLEKSMHTIFRELILTIMNGCLSEQGRKVFQTIEKDI